MSKIFKNLVVLLAILVVSGCATAPQWAKDNARETREQIIRNNEIGLSRNCRADVTEAMMFASFRATARGEEWDGSYLVPSCVEEGVRANEHQKARQSVVIPDNTGITVEEASIAGLGDEDDGECGNRVNRAIVSKTVGAILHDGNSGPGENTSFYKQGTDECVKRRVIKESTGWSGFWNRLAGSTVAGFQKTGFGAYIGVVPDHSRSSTRYGSYTNGRRQRLWRRVGYDSYGQQRVVHTLQWR